VIHYTISRRVHNANIVNRSGLRKSGVKREGKEMNKSKGDWDDVLTTSYPASSQSRRSNVNDVKDKILFQDYENSSKEVGKEEKRETKKKKKKKKKREEKRKREKKGKREKRGRMKEKRKEEER